MPPQKDSCLANEQLQFIGSKETTEPQDLDGHEPALVVHVRARLQDVSANIEIEKRRLKTCQFMDETRAANAAIKALENEALKYERYLRVILRAARLIDKQPSQKPS